MKMYEYNASLDDWFQDICRSRVPSAFVVVQDVLPDLPATYPIFLDKATDRESAPITILVHDLVLLVKLSIAKEDDPGLAIFQSAHEFGHCAFWNYYGKDRPGVGIGPSESPDKWNEEAICSALQICVTKMLCSQEFFTRCLCHLGQSRADYYATGAIIAKSVEFDASEVAELFKKWPNVDFSDYR